MSGETETNISGWTTDTLRSDIYRILEEMDRRYQQRYEAQQEGVAAALAAQEKAVNAALIAADRAVIKAELAAEKRFEAVNEFRATLADQAATLMPRAEAEARLLSMAEKLSEITNRINRSAGNGEGVHQSWAVVVAVVGMAIGAGGLILAVVR